MQWEKEEVKEGNNKQKQPNNKIKRGRFRKN